MKSKTALLLTFLSALLLLAGPQAMASPRATAAPAASGTPCQDGAKVTVDGIVRNLMPSKIGTLLFVEIPWV